MSTMIMNPQQFRTSHVRLTRRGRLVVLVAAFLLVVAAFVALSSGSVATSDRHTGGTTRVVQIAPGETLWEVASQASGGTDVRDMMVRIEELNGLQSTQLQAGQRLRVPLG